MVVTPQHLAGHGVEGEQPVERRGRIHHTVVHDGRSFQLARYSGGQRPGDTEVAHPVRRQLFDRAVAPSGVVAAEVKP